jgi:hypothetical protein
MTTMNSLMSLLNERTLAQNVVMPHDEARMRYPLNSNTVGSFDEFSNAIADYYNYHYTNCVTHGGRLPYSEAASKAKKLFEKEYRKRDGDIVAAYNDGHDGTNGGMRVVLDALAEGLKAESVENYTRDVFDRHVAPNSWEQKVNIIREFITDCGPHLLSSIDQDSPERYAQNYEALITLYVGGLQKTSSMFRRL